MGKSELTAQQEFCCVSTRERTENGDRIPDIVHSRDGDDDFWLRKILGIVDARPRHCAGLLVGPSSWTKVTSNFSSAAYRSLARMTRIMEVIGQTIYEDSFWLLLITFIPQEIRALVFDR